MRHPEGPRKDRRLRDRQEARRLADRAERTPEPPVERRAQDRRQMSMSSDEVDDWLKRNGISGGDRRKGDRRRG